MSSQNESQLSLFESELPPSAPTLLTIDLDESTQESESDQPIFMMDPRKQHALWKMEDHVQWMIWWTRKLCGGPYEKQFQTIPWSKPKRSASWSGFYQAIEIRSGAARAICRICWRVYSYPEGHKSGSSTSTLARHNSKCAPSQASQGRIDGAKGMIVSNTQPFQ